MGEVAGKLGGIYYSSATIRKHTISFDSSYSINDSGNGFILAGFTAGDKIVVTGTENNNGLKTIDTGGVAAGTLTLVEGTSTEAVGAEVTIVTAPDDAIGIGFFNWSFDDGVDIVDTTDFADGVAGYRTVTACLGNWSATAERYWHASGDYSLWIGKEIWVRFFTIWNTAPNDTNAYYYEGMATVDGISPNADVGDVVKSTISFKGDGPLTRVKRTSAWDT